MRLLCTAVLCTALLVSSGCESAKRSNLDSENSTAASSQTEQPSEELRRATETLKATGAELEQNSAGQVTSVDMGQVEVTDTLATQIALLDQLEELTIGESAMTTAGWQKLGQLVNLQQLDLRDCPLNNEQLDAILQDLPQLKALRLNGTSGRTTVDDGGLAGLANCPELKVLAIDGLWVGSPGLEHLKGNLKLIELYASGTTIDDAASALLAGFPNLRKLRLSRTSVGTAGIASLAKLPLEDLDISEASGVNDETLETVGHMQSLKRLNLWRDTVSDAGVEHLAGLTNIEWLNLDNTHLTDAGLPHLAGLTKLKFLHLGSTAVTDAGMPALVSLKSLKDLKVTRSAVTEAGVDVVKQAIPGIEIQLKYIEGE
ncbi:MAG: hypothetical protein IT422_17725 [Pirellulaceae bacterium]|nr:hypothetical protein [Pirellulaceae bacterium]